MTAGMPQAAWPSPEAPARNHAVPGFRFRGTKGWDWTPRQYLEEIPFLARLRMNFLMNCYLSLFTSSAGGPLKNEWWKPMTDSRRRDYSGIIRACRDQGILFCFAVHPQLDSPRPLDPANPEDVDRLYRQYAWAQGEGVHWFSVCLDDVGWGPDGPAAGGRAHARLADTLLERLRAGDPRAQLILCPAAYWGDGSDPAQRAYLGALGRALHPEVYVFWTGDGVYSRHITRRAAQGYRSAVNHRLFLWDNYPVNDGKPTMNLGPLSGRDPDLCEVVDGYMSNPMRAQNQVNRIPLATCADYSWNPWAYDPARSLGRAILLFSRSAAQRQALADLVGTYPGFLATGGDSGTNPVRTRFASLFAMPESRPAARALARQTESLEARLEKAFPGSFDDAKESVRDDIRWMQGQRE